ncbi:MAG TPA: HypC/HybG/HupF family hydrogenase formation chaperone [Bacteroidota bacterium]|nr:HypC/HybG/HupF family hydrogenase formation chaperone [Bacteroidota bacterium]
MNLVSGIIEEIYVREGMAMGRINVRGALMNVSLTFLMDARIGDTILVESGVAISKTQLQTASEN